MICTLFFTIFSNGNIHMVDIARIGKKTTLDMIIKKKKNDECCCDDDVTNTNKTFCDKWNGKMCEFEFGNHHSLYLCVMMTDTIYIFHLKHRQLWILFGGAMNMVSKRPKLNAIVIGASKCHFSSILRRKKKQIRKKSFASFLLWLQNQ